jgi:NAD(P)-dependent dehydrogenase (short-subunit alcohol dehydrogenase family)
MTTLQIPTELPPGLLRDRVILVTGAGAGLGRATALACAAAGATVVLLGRTVAKLESTYDDIIAAGGAEPAIYPMNLSGVSDRDVHELAERISDSLGGLHGIVHCAVNWKDFRPMQDVLAPDWLDSLQVNLNAPWAITRAALPALKASTSGVVIFLGCACGHEPRAYHGAYGVAKAALDGMVHGWVLEKPGVRLHVLDPGPMRTSLRRRGYPGEAMDAQPKPERAAQAITWLLSPDGVPQPDVSMPGASTPAVRLSLADVTA